MGNIRGAAQLYLKVAMLRRGALVRDAGLRIVLAIFAFVSLLIALVAVDIGLFLWLSMHVQAFHAAWIVAVGHILLGAVFAIAAGMGRNLPERKALAEAEAAALAAVTTEAAGFIKGFCKFERSLESMGGTAVMALAAIMSVLGLLTGRRNSN
jgi:hypothetical protein